MPGHVILSHGSNSGPDAAKVSALAQVARDLGWSTVNPDYRAADALGYAGAAPARVAQLVEFMRSAPRRPLVLAGSSMGAYVSGLASLQAPCDGLFLMALPIDIPGCPRFAAAAGVRGMLVHGYRDDLCPVEAASAFARGRGMPALLVDDGHRLGDHLEVLQQQFALFLRAFAD